MFNLLCERADNTYGGRLPYHVRVLWDEAANTGQVPGLEKIVAVIRSREISLTLFYQAMSQCKALYKDHSETIMGNMDSIVFLGGREASTLKDISENWLGKATISMQTEGRSRGQSESYSQNMQRLGRELMTTSEITTMPGDKCILQLRGLPPFLSPKYDLKSTRITSTQPNLIKEKRLPLGKPVPPPAIETKAGGRIHGVRSGRLRHGRRS